MLGRCQHKQQQNSAEGQIMTNAEKELMIKIRQQAVVGNGLFMNDVEFKAWACRTYNIKEDRLTQLMREVI